MYNSKTVQVSYFMEEKTKSRFQHKIPKPIKTVSFFNKFNKLNFVVKSKKFKNNFLVYYKK